MSALSPLSLRRRLSRQWASRIRSLKQIRNQIVVATGQALQGAFAHDGALIPVPIRVVAGRRRSGHSRD
jgi:hypothetical protein